MNENTNDSNDLYPTPTRGPLKHDSSVVPQEHKQRKWGRLHDFSSISLLVMIILIVFAFGIGCFYIVYRATHHTVSQQELALKIAHEVVKHNSPENYSELKQETNKTLQDCKGTPTVTVTHTYPSQQVDKPPRTDTSTLEIKQNMDISDFLLSMTEKADGASSNEYSVTCS